MVHLRVRWQGRALGRAFGCTLGVACLTLLGERQHAEAGNKDCGDHHFARVHGVSPFMLRG